MSVKIYIIYFSLFFQASRAQEVRKPFSKASSHNFSQLQDGYAAMPWTKDGSENLYLPSLSDFLKLKIYFKRTV